MLSNAVEAKRGVVSAAILSEGAQCLGEHGVSILVRAVVTPVSQCSAVVLISAAHGSVDSPC